MMGKSRAGMFATSIRARCPPVRGGFELRAENLRHLTKLQRPKPRLDQVRISGMKGLQLRLATSPGARGQLVLWSINREQHDGKTRATEQSQQKGDGHA